MKSKAFKCLVTVFCCTAFFVSQSSSAAWEEFAVSPFTNDQLSPDIDGDIIVWQEKVEYNGQLDWDIYGIDIFDSTGNLIFIAEYNDDQVTPVISGNNVAFASFVETDFDVLIADITDVANIDVFAVSQQVNIDEQAPAIHGNTVVWQDDRNVDVDIFVLDIINGSTTGDYIVTSNTSDQQAPAIYRNRVVSQDKSSGYWNIVSQDIWLRGDPKEYSVTTDQGAQQAPAISGDIVVFHDDIYGDNDIFAADISGPGIPDIITIASIEGEQTNPDIDGNIIVWQDKWSGNWDIYGYNLTTGVEFLITDNPYDQTNPVISGNIVAWEDNRDGNWQIYAVELDGAEIAKCLTDIQGDLNGDCHVNLADLAILSANWLTCDMVTSTDCEI